MGEGGNMSGVGRRDAAARVGAQYLWPPPPAGGDAQRESVQPGSHRQSRSPSGQAGSRMGGGGNRLTERGEGEEPS